MVQLYQWFLICMLLICSSSFSQATSSFSKLALPNRILKLPKNKETSLSPEKLSKVLQLRAGGTEIDWRYFLAGGICAAWSHGITTPIDVVKTRMQQYPEKYTSGVISAARDIIATEGVSFLLAGLGPTVVGYGLEGALKFGFYESFKKILAQVTPYQFVNFLLASVVAGAVASVVLCPMEEARIKMVGDASWSKENVVSAILRMAREDGLFASFAGLAAMLSKQIPYTMGKQVSFDVITKLLYSFAEANLQFTREQLKWVISVASAFLASIIACLCSQPGDMILTATYKGGHGHCHSHGDCHEHEQEVSSGDKRFCSVVCSIYKKHGLKGFYLGTQARIAHVASIITSQLVVYDLIKMALGLPVTGSH